MFEAVDLARGLAAAGDFDIFRGQLANHPLTPSSLRFGADPNEVVERLEQFQSWVLQTPELSSLHDDPELVLAVAQHYGLRTSLLDFTYDAEVAGYFASHGEPSGDQASSEVTSCIVCGSVQQITRAWADINERHRSTRGFDLVRVLQVDVKNLWRLQSQRGVFLKVHVDATFLEMFSGFLHIEFPWHPDRQVKPKREIYPRNRSHLEILLDQYFLIESYESRDQQLRQLFTPIFVKHERYEGDPTYFIGDTLPPPHRSWSDAALSAWRSEPDERFGVEQQGTTVTIEVSRGKEPRSQFLALTRRLEGECKKGLREVHGVRFLVVDESGVDVCTEAIDPDAAQPLRVGDVLSILFDGMRKKPYTDTSVSRGIAFYATMSVGDGWQAMKAVLSEIVGIEFEGGFTRARGFCDARSLREAIREDFFAFVKPEKVSIVEAEGAAGIIGILADPRRLFVFEHFCAMFAEQALPTAARAMVEGTVLPFNAARVAVFGVS